MAPRRPDLPPGLLEGKEDTVLGQPMINADLAQAADNVNRLAQVINDAATLVGATEDLLKTAASFGIANT